MQGTGEESRGKRPMRKWEDNIKMGLQELGWRILHGIDMAQGKDR